MIRVKYNLWVCGKVSEVKVSKVGLRVRLRVRIVARVRVASKAKAAASVIDEFVVRGRVDVRVTKWSEQRHR